MGAGGAAADDVQLRPFLGDDDVVHVLLDVVLVHVQAGLDGMDGLGPGRARIM